MEGDPTTEQKIKWWRDRAAEISRVAEHIAATGPHHPAFDDAIDTIRFAESEIGSGIVALELKVRDRAE
jgi:hypothetical protein